ncbi:hypothetical protein HanRHA438_Chr09g0408981 [Helianthus annuus]|nr:hypothetical protein HanRHA438_Chr09g0408981 [Helianthus annuus]
MRWAVEVAEAEAEELLKWWKRDVALIRLKAAEVEVVVVVVRLRASSISSLSYIFSNFVFIVHIRGICIHIKIYIYYV